MTRRRKSRRKQLNAIERALRAKLEDRSIQAYLAYVLDVERGDLPDIVARARAAAPSEVLQRLPAILERKALGTAGHLTSDFTGVVAELATYAADHPLAREWEERIDDHLEMCVDLSQHCRWSRPREPFSAIWILHLCGELDMAALRQAVTTFQDEE